MQRQQLDRNDQAGFVVLLSVLVVVVVGSVIAVVLLNLAVGAGRTGLDWEDGKQAQAIADACAEEALQQIADSTPFTGSGNLSLDDGTCAYDVTSQGGQNRTIEATGEAGQAIRRVKIVIDVINPNINIVRWEEVADF